MSRFVQINVVIDTDGKSVGLDCVVDSAVSYVGELSTSEAKALLAVLMPLVGRASGRRREAERDDAAVVGSEA